MTATTERQGDVTRKIAVVSHDYNVVDRDERWDYSEHFQAINARCDAEGCDTILYALFTLDKTGPARSRDSVFGKLVNVNTVVVETGDFDFACEQYDSFKHLSVEVWRRGEALPMIMKQTFARSAAPDVDKQAFMNALPVRRVADALVVICGESNIASTLQGEWNDPFGFGRELDALGVRVVLNPIHDHMPWSAMLEKRRRYSARGRTVVSVWNAGRGGVEAEVPWTVFVNGEDRTPAVRELSTVLADRPDIRIGVVDVQRGAPLRGAT